MSCKVKPLYSSINSARELIANAVKDVFESREGFYLLRTPTGSGKTTAIINQIKRHANKKICIVVNDHKAATDMKNELEARGISDVFTYPKLTGSNCENFDLAQNLMDGGLAVKSICPSCQFADECKAIGYLSLLKKPREERIKIIVRQRVELVGFEECDITIIDEDSLNTFCPVEDIDEATLRKAHNVLLPLADQFKPAKLMLTLVESILNWEGPPVVYFVKEEMAELCESEGFNPFQVAAKLAQHLKERGEKLGKNVLRILSWILTGKTKLMCRIETQEKKTEKVVRTFLTCNHRNLPQSPVVLYSDATADLKILEEVTGLYVIDMLPNIQFRNIHSCEHHILNVPVTDGFRRCKWYILAMLAKHSKERVAVISFKRHVITLIEDELYKLNPPELMTYFGSNMSTGSNEIHYGKSILLLIVGQYCVNPFGVRKNLLQRGKIDQALMSDPKRRRKSCNGFDAEGNPVEYTIPSYEDKEWEISASYLNHSKMLQTVGRARAALPEGIGCTVIGECEPLGFPIIKNSNLNTIYDSHTSTLPDFLKVFMCIKQFGPIKPDRIAEELSLSGKQVRTQREKLLKIGWIEKKYKRSNGKRVLLGYGVA